MYAAQKKTKKVNYKNRNPWIDQKLKSMIAERERLLIVKVNNPTDDTISTLKKNRNKVISLQRKAERNYYKEQLEINEHDLRKSWNVIKDIIGKEGKNKQNKSAKFIIDNKTSTDSYEIANHFNNYFLNVGTNLTSKINSNIDPLSYITKNKYTLSIPYIEETEVLNALLSLKNSAAGYDGIPGSIMKQCAQQYLAELTYIINCSILEGYIPDELKLAKVLHIFKSDDENKIENYRPISILPFFSKVFEKIVANHVIEFLDKHNILYEKQFGFRKCHSTSHAIITLVEIVSRALDSGKVIVGVFLDLKKAFDTVDHEILLDKLNSYGINNNLHAWFESYLHNRSQFVFHNNNKSETKHITHGVPQGSILGPLLFIIYVNDFSRASDLLFSIMFADDTSVFIEGHSFNEVIESLNTELKKVSFWLQSNKLTLNVKKSHYMVFHRSRIKHNQMAIKIQNCTINKTDSIKFLGVIIDNKLNWHEHIIYIKNKISKSIGIIYKVRKYVEKQTIKNMYYTFVFPYFIYCNEIWGNACQAYVDPLIKLQKKIVRIMTFSSHDAHTEPLFKTLHVLKFKKLVIQRIALMMFKFSIRELPIPVLQLFSRNSEIHNYNTRGNKLLRTKIGSSEATYANFSFHAVYIWNIISKEIPTDVSYSCFKHLSKHFIQEQDNDVGCCHIEYRLRT